MITFILLFSFLFSLELIALGFFFFLITNITMDSLLEPHKIFQYNQRLCIIY